MGGLTADTPIPTEIKLHQQSRVMEIAFNNGDRLNFRMNICGLLALSRGAWSRPGQETLQVGKKNVDIKNIEPVACMPSRWCFRWPRFRHLFLGLSV